VIHVNNGVNGRSEGKGLDYVLSKLPRGDKFSSDELDPTAPTPNEGEGEGIG
jgi:hypothetical protein